MRLLALLAVAACAGHASPPIVAQGSATAPPPAPPALACVEGAPRGDWNPYEQARTVEGNVDACDADGNLVSYQCELRDLACHRGRNFGRSEVAPCYEQTGRAIAETVDCDGRCVAGACRSRCPAAGDRLTVTSIGATGQVVFASDADARAIACALAYDQPGDTFQCATDRKLGDVLTVAGLGLSTTTCTGGAWGAISDAQCTYSDCRYVR